MLLKKVSFGKWAQALPAAPSYCTLERDILPLVPLKVLAADPIPPPTRLLGPSAERILAENSSWQTTRQTKKPGEKRPFEMTCTPHYINGETEAQRIKGLHSELVIGSWLISVVTTRAALPPQALPGDTERTQYMETEYISLYFFTIGFQSLLGDNDYFAQVERNSCVHWASAKCQILE